jgi:hypothetical protein
MKSRRRSSNSNQRFEVAAIRLDEQARFLRDCPSLHGSESGGALFPRWFFVSSGPAIPEKQLSGEANQINNGE